MAAVLASEMHYVMGITARLSDYHAKVKHLTTCIFLLLVNLSQMWFSKWSMLLTSSHTRPAAPDVACEVGSIGCCVGRWLITTCRYDESRSHSIGSKNCGCKNDIWSALWNDIKTSDRLYGMTSRHLVGSME